MDEEIIDLGEYARRKEAEREPARATFAIWGGEGERARFALPLWRAAYLAGGSRACLAWDRHGSGAAELEPLVVLDLASDPARTGVPVDRIAHLTDAVSPPALSRSSDGVTVYLGEREGRRWYLVVDHPVPSDDPDGPETEGLDDLYFLAGECAGLLFHRELDTEADPYGP